MAKTEAAKPALAVRCAIYTRKSSEEGLDQDFNSLHAQREACEAYVRSQAGEGWRLLSTLYDDGGYSGGNIERPALQRLLADIDRGAVDTVVVYKIDRLTRSLMDFAKIVDRFDAKGASFVSVTQSFNTTTSMGRLTLNVLLSFAQFEREVTGERIRDKLAASKKKGLWMGGSLPLGYDANGRTLAINEAEAEQVRHIFARYLEVKSGYELCQELEAQGYSSKIRKTRAGNVMGGAKIGLGALYHLLSNPVYIGQIAHKQERYAGLHLPIVEIEVFEAVQQKLAKSRRESRREPTPRKSFPLSGRLFDEDGGLMTATSAYGNGVRYRYYVATASKAGRPVTSDRIQRLSGPEIEALVVDRVGRLLGLEGVAEAELLARILRVDIKPESLSCEIEAPSDAHAAMRAIEQRLGEGDRAWLQDDPPRLKMIFAVRSKRRGGRSWTILAPGRTPGLKARHDRALINALRRAHAVLRGCNFSPTAPLDSLLESSSPTNAYQRRISALAFLAPDIQTAILEGKQRPGLTLQTLMEADIPRSWADQRKLLG